MAAAILEAMHPGKYYVRSAGVEARDIDGFTVATLREKHIDISDHKSKRFSDIDDDSFDMIIALTDFAYQIVKEWAKPYAIEVMQWSIMEPVYHQRRQETLQCFEEIYQQLYQAINKEFS